MQLVDLLDERLTSVKMYERPLDVEVLLSDGNNEVYIGGARYGISEQALGAMLNILKIPIKHIERLVIADGGYLANSVINFWISQEPGCLSFLIDVREDPSISQVFSGGAMYLPGIKINDLVVDILGNCSVMPNFRVEDDLFEAVYITDSTEEIGGVIFSRGVRVLYSDCFRFTPRFDAVLVTDYGGMLCWPTEGRKFRVAANTVSQIMDQIYDFISLTLASMDDKLIPAIKDDAVEINPDKYITELCSQLRLNQKVRVQMTEFIQAEYTGLEMALVLSLFRSGLLTPTMERDIQVAATSMLYRGSFK
jgi:hypothetical protein